MAQGNADLPVDLVVRFSTSDPDQVLRITDIRRTSGLRLKQRIRDGLSEATRHNRLRLIHAGKVISDPDSLSKSLSKLPPPPQHEDVTAKSEKARGKLAVRETRAAARVYVHCSIGDTLSQTELSAEATAANDADAALSSAVTLSYTTPAQLSVQAAEPTMSTTPAPQGFDRLLSSGFTPAEVASLRTQFLAIQAHTHTPDTMPTGPALLALEERWLEQPNANAGNGGNGEDFNDDGLDDMLIGTLVGFFWPIGGVCWLMREEGVWSRRRQLMVMLGFFINLMFGFLRMLR